MIRQPISRPWRIGLGVASVLVLIALYTLLSQHRHRLRQLDRLADIEAQLAKIDDSRRNLAKRRSAAQQMEDQTRQIAELERVEKEKKRLDGLPAERELAAQYEHPDGYDRTIPLWSRLYHDGLIRACSPQGLKKNQYWLWEDLLATAGRLLAGLLVGVVLSVALGVLMGCFAPVEAFFVPPLSFLSKIPPTAMLAVFFVLVGTTFKMYVAMIAFGMLPTLAQAVYQSAKKDVPEELIYKAYTLGAHNTELIWNVVFKQILPRVLDAIRLQIGPAMVLLVAAEWTIAGEGFGYRLRLFCG